MFFSAIDLKRRLLTDVCEDQPPRPQDFAYVGDSPFGEKKRRVYEYEMFGRGAYPQPPTRSLPPSRRLSSTELLLRIFPKMKINILHLILQACAGDVIQAIEQILAKFKPENINPFASPHLASLEGHSLAKDFQLRSEAFQFPRSSTNFFPTFQSSAFSPVVFSNHQPPVGPYPLKTKCHEESSSHRANFYTMESRDFVNHASTAALSRSKIGDANEKTEKDAKENCNKL